MTMIFVVSISVDLFYCTVQINRIVQNCLMFTVRDLTIIFMTIEFLTLVVQYVLFSGLSTLP